MDIIEGYCGARLTHAAIRIGGVPLDIQDSFIAQFKRLFRQVTCKY